MFSTIIISSLIIGAIIGLITHDKMWFPSISEHIASAVFGAWIAGSIGFIIACIFVGCPQ